MTTLIEVSERLNEVATRLQANQFIQTVYYERSVAADSFSGHIERVCQSLGRHVAEAAQEVGGLVIEAKKKPTSSEVDRVDAILEAAQLRNWQRDMLTAGYEARYTTAYEALNNALRSHGFPAQYREGVASRVLAEGGRRLGLLDLREGTKTALFNVLERAREQGLSPLEAAKYIEAFVPSGQFVNAGVGYRSQMIARSEINHAWRYASLETFKTADWVNRVIMYDGESDAECSSRNGAIVTIDEAEFEMFVTHPNCVLAFAPAYV